MVSLMLLVTMMKRLSRNLKKVRKHIHLEDNLKENVAVEVEEEEDNVVNVVEEEEVEVVKLMAKKENSEAEEEEASEAAREAVVVKEIGSATETKMVTKKDQEVEEAEAVEEVKIKELYLVLNKLALDHKQHNHNEL